MQFTGEPRIDFPTCYRFSGRSTALDQSGEPPQFYQRYRSRDELHTQVTRWRSGRPSGGGSRLHRRGRRAGRRLQQRRAGPSDRSQQLGPDYQRVLIELQPGPDREPTQTEGPTGDGPSNGGGEGQLHDNNVAEYPLLCQSTCHDNDSRPQQHGAQAPTPPESAADDGAAISVRVDRHTGPWPRGARMTRPAGYGGDARCLARPATPEPPEQQSCQIRAPTSPAAAGSLADGQNIYPITVRVETRHAGRPASAHASCPAAAERCLLRPPRLTAQQTRQAGRGQRSGPTAPPRRTLRIAHINPRSLMPSLDDVIDIVTRENIDVLGVSESWLRPSVEDSFLIILGYKCERQDRARGRGGGTCIIYRNTLTAERLRVPTGGSELETLWLSFGRCQRAVIGVAYRPPRGAVTPQLDDLRDQLAHLLGKGGQVYLLGDMNLDVLSPRKPGVSNYMQMLSDMHLKQIVIEPTHREGSTLDHIVVPETDQGVPVRVVPFHSSDHDLVMADIRVALRRHRPIEITVRSMRNLDPNALCLDLLEADWSELYNESDDVGVMWQSFMNVWRPVIDKHMPMVTIKLRHPPCPWIAEDHDVMACMRERDLARADRDANRNTPRREDTEAEYRRARNAAKAAQSRARSNFFLTSYRHSKPKIWTDIRKFLIASKRDSTDRKTTDVKSTEWADALNTHFASVGPGIASSLETVAAAGQRLTPRPPRVISGAFRVHPTTLSELSSALAQMNNSKSSGADGITVAMLKQTFPVIGPHLLRIVNASIRTGTLPDEWKLAIVTPLFKSGDATDVNCFRPVSVLPTVSKLAERVVCNQLVEYLTLHNVICPEQHGFRRGHSTESAMLDAVQFIISETDKGKVVSNIAADISKAFDSVEHGRLMDKLGWHGVDGHWFSDWLDGRRQKVKGGSHLLPVTHGVVQGSTLGAILFSLFTNDVASHVVCDKIVMYADDSQFLNSFNKNDMNSHKRKVEDMLSIVQNWYDQNGLKINPAKTEMILFGMPKQGIVGDIMVNFAGAQVRPAIKMKVLGVTLDPELKWEDHVSMVIRRSYATLAGLAKFSHSLPTAVKKFIVEALVFPHIEYCLTVWGGCRDVQRKRVQKVLNHAAQITTSSRRNAHVTPLFAELNWQNLDKLIVEKDILTIHKILKDGTYSANLKALLESRADISARSTRAVEAGQLQLPKVRTERARRFFTYRAVASWNGAPPAVREAPTVRQCRKNVRENALV